MPTNDEHVNGVKISSFPSAQSIDSADLVTGLKNNNGVITNTNFTFSTILAWIRQRIFEFYIPLSAKGQADGVASLDSSGKVTDTQIPFSSNNPLMDGTASAGTATTLPRSDHRHPSDTNKISTSEKGTPLGVAELDSNGQVPSSQLDLSGKQDTIIASGILKGDGNGGVSAATAGMDFQAPLTIDATPTANSTNPVKSGGVYFATAGYGLGVMLNTQTAIADCDSVSVTGWFNTDNNTLHCPTGANKNSVLYCVTRGAQYAYQEFYDPFNAKLYRRWKNQTSPWEAWYLSDNGSPAFEQQLAVSQIGPKANRYYAANSCFCWNGLLFRATSAISNGADLIINTNCVQTTVMDEIIRLTA